jgi:dTDP-4-dehydrorhamnose 3,5-epimerase
MTKFKIVRTPIPDLYIIEPTVFGDQRGFFMETYNRKEFHELGIAIDFVQDNHSRSKKGTLRGLHFQKQYAQSKLVRVVNGAVFDVVVDIRPDSSTFGEWFGCVLSEENKKLLFVPEGFAHGFLVLTESADFLYKCSEFYHPEFEAGIIWNDEDIAIDWPLKEYGVDELILSEKDRKLPKLKELTLRGEL